MPSSTTLRRTWERVVAERRPQLVTVFGPAGIGKTRLGDEFIDRVREGGGRALRGRSVPYGGRTAYGPFGNQVKQVARIYDSDSAPIALEKLSECGRGRSSRVTPRRSRSPYRAAPRHRGRGPTYATARCCFFRPAGSSEGWLPRRRRRSSSRICTGLTRACSTCSRPSRRACGTCPCCSSRSPGRSC